MNWRDLMQRRPETLSILEWHSLLTKFETLERDKIGALKERPPYNVLVTDAVGFEHEFDLSRVGYRTDKPPRSFLLPVKPRLSRCNWMNADELYPETRSTSREFKLVGYRGWDRMPLYEEVV